MANAALNSIDSILFWKELLLTWSYIISPQSRWGQTNGLYIVSKYGQDNHDKVWDEFILFGLLFE